MVCIRMNDETVETTDEIARSIPLVAHWLEIRDSLVDFGVQEDRPPRSLHWVVEYAMWRELPRCAPGEEDAVRKELDFYGFPDAVGARGCAELSRDLATADDTADRLLSLVELLGSEVCTESWADATAFFARQCAELALTARSEEVRTWAARQR